MEERTVIITKVVKLKALGVSERKLGNTGAAETIELKVKTLITKYSITERELGVTQTSYQSQKPQYKEPPKSYSSMEDALRDHVNKMKQEHERAYRGYSGYSDGRYREYTEQKTYRYKADFTCAVNVDVRRLLAAMCAQCDVDIESLDRETNESFFYNATKQTIVFSVIGTVENLAEFKALFIRLSRSL